MTKKVPAPFIFQTLKPTHKRNTIKIGLKVID